MILLNFVQYVNSRSHVSNMYDLQEHLAHRHRTRSGLLGNNAEGMPCQCRHLK